MVLEAAETPSSAQLRINPPFRADHVGSLLRPPGLKTARESHLGAHTAVDNLGPHHNDALEAIEDDYIREAIAMQERVGLKVATDGELRRRSWMLEMLLAWDGISANRSAGGAVKWRNESGSSQDMTAFDIKDKIRWRPGAVVPAFEFLKAETRLVPKVGLPSPNVVHYFLAGDGRLDPAIYSDMDAFWHDLVAAYRQEIAALAEAGATYIQIDDVCFAYLCDPVHREHVESRGYDPDALVHLYAEKINEILSEAPEQVTFTLHTCRGNREGQWVAEGAYDAVADVLFNTINVAAFFLEYDTERAGGFDPLRHLPRNKIAALGLVSSKRPELESADSLLRRIDEAARIVPLDQLAISPQCGFASSFRGNPLTLEDQEAKLRRLVEVAEQTWSDA
jgi:5-methyltetrahydropteroyltriglutamate--homocysteine methyltransferase